MTFEDLKFETDEMGEHSFHIYDNHYGVSVVRGPYTYGGRKGLYELAVIHMGPEDKESTIVYNTPITNDVMGYLTPEDVTRIMKQVSELDINLTSHEKMICGQCDKDIVETGDHYFIMKDQHDGDWHQCFDCYSRQEEDFYRDAEESYADHYNRTNDNLHGEDDPNQWDEEQ